MAKKSADKADYRRKVWPDHATLPFGATPKPAITVFATFGAHRPRYRRAAFRLATEALSSAWFDKVVLQLDTGVASDEVVPDGLTIMPPDWSETDAAFIRGNPRGFGYWLWKPLLIKALLEEMEDGSLLVYADGGCELSSRGGPRLLDYLQSASTTGGLFFSLPFAEAEYSKQELLDHMQATPEEVETTQVQGTILVLCNRADTRVLVDQWIALCREDGYRLLNDDCNPGRQSSRFRSHRHDQAILSLLVKRSSFAVIPWEDNYDKPLYRILNSWIYLFPIHARRAQRRRILWWLSGWSSDRGCLAAAQGSFGFRLQKTVADILSLRFLKSP
ncbi:hypothetical protein HGO38_21315 [Rhizobium sp. CG5]|uniref:hypothetical protein n=1 Tax=Rhizobium sp. CG5 TaxID=2726076 RepID=UPI0020343FBA|nr:hypothetical protein [Rhizobium sp. CG5]MCM2476019.1 hypothetical protein [Rhizobium sp. CG5]